MHMCGWLLPSTIAPLRQQIVLHGRQWDEMHLTPASQGASSLSAQSAALGPHLPAWGVPEVVDLETFHWSEDEWRHAWRARTHLPPARLAPRKTMSSRSMWLFMAGLPRGWRCISANSGEEFAQNGDKLCVHFCCPPQRAQATP
jgi:hypothetical protein